VVTQLTVAKAAADPIENVLKRQRVNVNPELPTK
jgi:hypothetical protein